MSRVQAATQRCLDLLATLNAGVAGILFAALTVVVSLQVFTRFVLHIPAIWSEEVARFLFFWVVLLGSAMSVKSRRHFVIDVTMSGRPAVGAGVAGLLLRLVPDLCVLGFSLLLVVEGIGYAEVGLLRTATNSGVNMALVYAAIPVFAGLSAVYSAGNIILDCFAYREETGSATGPEAED
ncbi:MAG: TRAP transporter small permease [Gemmatimonadota bacterium]